MEPVPEETTRLVFPLEKTCRCGKVSLNPREDFPTQSRMVKGVKVVYLHSLCKECRAKTERIRRKGTAEHQERRCPTCGLPRTQENRALFSIARWKTKEGIRSGPSSLCLSCIRALNKKKRADPEERRYQSAQRRRRYYANQDECTAESRAYHEKHRTKLIAKKRRVRHDDRLVRQAGVVLTLVGDYYGIHPTELRTAQRSELSGEARAVCCRLLRAWAHLSNDAIGLLLGLDRSTVIHHWSSMSTTRGSKEKRMVLSDCWVILREAGELLRAEQGKATRRRTGQRKAA